MFLSRASANHALPGTPCVYVRRSIPGTNLPDPLSNEPDRKDHMKTTFAQHIVRQALFAAVLAGIALSCLASCSKSAPETPMERSRVLLRIFDNLERRDNEEALKSIETYRNLDPTNEFLSNFEHIVRENSVIASAKAKLDADDITEAAVASTERTVLIPERTLVSLYRKEFRKAISS